MILRRLSQSLKEQNWTAICIEFVLLVLGVYMGIQVANWNAARIFSAQEHAYLQELREEIRANIRQIEYRKAYYRTVLESGAAAAKFLQQDAPCTSDCSALLADFFLASQFWGTPLARTTYNEMQRLGLPRSKAIREQMQVYFISAEGLAVTVDAVPRYREHVRGFLGTELTQGLWQDCWSIDRGRLETLRGDCKARLGNDQATAVLEEIRHAEGVWQELNVWMGMNTVGMQLYDFMLRDANTLSAAIDREIGK
jgi:hypothetical protein